MFLVDKVAHLRQLATCSSRNWSVIIGIYKRIHYCDNLDGQLQLSNSGRNCKCSYLQLLLRYGLYLEHFPQTSKEVEDLYFQFHANEKFKQELQNNFLRYFKFLFTYKKIGKSNQREILQQILVLKYHHPQQTEEYYQKIIEMLDQYINEYQKQNKHQFIFAKAVIFEHHTQFVSSEFQTDFFLHSSMKNVYEQFEYSYNQLTLRELDGYGTLFSLIYLFKLRFDYSFHQDITLTLIKQLVKDTLFSKMQEQLILPTQLPVEFYNKYTLCQIIQSMSTQKPVLDDNMLNQNFILYYVYIQTQALTMLVQGFNHTLLNQKQTFILKQNLNNFMLYWSYQCLIQRNKNQSNLNQFENEHGLFNASLIDKIFTFFLAIYYFQNDGNFSQLPLILEEQWDSIYQTLTKSYVKVFNSYIFGQKMQNKDLNLFAIYSGSYSQQFVNLRSFDLSFMKLYLYMFREKGFETFLMLWESPNLEQLNLLCWKQELVLQLLISDQDLMTVAGSSFQELPKELKYFFRKVIRSLFMLKNYHSQKELVKLLKQMQYYDQLSFDNYVLEICELDTQLRELKLKVQYNQKLFEPYLFKQCPEIKSQIIEILYEKNNENISLSFGNCIEHDLKYMNDEKQSTLGNIRKELWQMILKNSQVYNCLTNLNFVNKVEEGKSYKQLTDFQLLIYTLQQGQIHFFVDDEILTEKLKVSYKAVKTILCQNTQNIKGQNQISTNDYEQLIERSFTNQEVKQGSQKQEEKKQSNKKDALRQKFLEKQKKFQNKFLAENQKEAVEELEYSEVCLLCSSPLGEDICYPALIQLNNLNDYVKFYPKQDCYFLLTTCQHKFHEQCIKSTFAQEKQHLPIWTTVYCPYCKGAMNLILSHKKDNNDFFNDLMVMINREEQFILYFFKEDKNESQVYIQALYSIIFNFINRMLQDYNQYLDKQVRVIIQVILSALHSYIQKDPIRKEYLNQVNQNNNVNWIGWEILDTIIFYLLEDLNSFKQSLEKLNTQSKQFSQEILQVLKLDQQINYNTETQQNEQIEAFQIENQRKIIIDRISKELGQNFNEFYQRFFFADCFNCKYYPLKYNSDSPAQQFICLICFQKTCPVVCTQDKQEYGNLNKHAIENHFGKTMYISLTNGWVVLCNSPITIQHYKCLFFNNLGQEVDIQNVKIDWQSYKLNMNALKQLVEIMIYKEESSLIRAIEIYRSYLEVNGRL